MKILTRYILREHIGPLLFALTALTSLLMLQFVARQLGNLVGKGLPWRVIGEFFLLSLPFTIAMTLPMAVLVATLHAFGRMASEHEITAFKASGVRVTTLMWPVIVGAAVLAMGMVAFNDQVLPRANHRLRILQQDMAKTKPTFALNEQTLNQVTTGFYMRIGRLDRESNKMRDVIIYDLSTPFEPKTIYADSGDLAFTPNMKDLQLVLFDGYQQQLDQTDKRLLRRSYFRSQAVRVKEIGNQFEQTGNDSWKGDREKSICEMQSEYVVNAREYERVRQMYIETARKSAAPGQQTMRVPRPRPATEGLAKVYCNGLALIFRVPTAVPSATPVVQPTTVAQGSQPGVVPAAQPGAVGTPGAALPAGTPGAPVPTVALTPGMQAQLEAAKRAMAASQPVVDTAALRAAAAQAAAAAAAAAMPVTTTAGDSSRTQAVVVNIRPDSAPPTGVPVPGTTRVIPSIPGATPGTVAPVTVPAAPLVNGAVASVVPPAPIATPPGAPVPSAAAVAVPAAVAPAVPAAGTPPAAPAPAPASVDPSVLADQQASAAAALNSVTMQLGLVRGGMDSLAVEIQKKFALSFACIVFVLFGPPIALRFPRGGVGATLGVSLVVFGLYYVCLMAGETLADNGKLPPVVAMWIANVIFTIAGVLLLLRIEQTADASRGGGIRAWLDERRARRAARSVRVSTPAVAG